MRRVYTDVSAFRAPFRSPNISFAGLGSSWPAGRSYQSVHYFRAPYQNGYYQSGALRGAEIPGGAVLALYAVVGGALGAGAAVFWKKQPLVPVLFGASVGLVLASKGG